ncbi:MAG: bifunctional UDP-N-acetylglucosamine diphosphorylase/glucosamine-1-phosphate N-acetyltransferase GlmU [Coriobacteriaceae bacterium]|nr:bifunctional UDP-N-acetylglucosamine diphosphorylase/glucosamine-1-phosphate N-acetyltransferase GlmU [Coriobacteriaceae bacterium]
MEARALILAAGLGTRMKSDRPKVAHEMLGKPLVRWVVDAAHEAGCEQVHVVIGSGKELVEPLLDDCTISYQLDMFGTGHTVMCAREALEGFTGCTVVLCGDSPLIRPQTIADLVQAHQEAGAAATVLTMDLDDPSGYGRIIRDESGNVCGIVEEKDCDDAQRSCTECNSGVYCFDTPMLLEHLDELGRDNAQGEYYLTDIIGLLVEAGQKVAAYVVADDSECLGINSRLQLAEATKVAQRRINEAWMAEGVTMLDPEQVWIGPDCQLGRDTEILPQTILSGATSIGSDCVLGPNTRLTDCTVGDACTLEETVGISAVLEDEVTCGPRAYLRPEAHIGHGAHIGTHVEIKKTTIGANTKVPHLSYLGDTTVGEDSNIGAGTITCNYDGFIKNPTVIGDRAFIGSDSIIVAPVHIGNDTFTGAASCISKDVPDGALALERSEQQTLEGWTLNKKKEMEQKEDKDEGE